MTTIITEAEHKYLLENMKALLSKYDHYYTTEALELIIDKWATEKASLIEAFKRHPNYLEGKFMIVFDVDYERFTNKSTVRHFSEWICYEVIQQYRDIPSPIDERRRRDGCAYLPDRLYRFLSDLGTCCETQISEETYNTLQYIIPEVRVHKGEKFSRVVNKICKYLGYNRHPDYNKKYAQFADAVTPMVIKRHTVLSINPLDYLTMSFGNSWASCHTIDKTNKRDMPNAYHGQYCSGTISYMLDKVSMVLYTVDAKYNRNEYWDQPKVTRQMFHWGEDKLVQGRLYPQGHDGNGEAYNPYRQIVQNIMSTIFDFPNLWTVKKGTCPIYDIVITHGTHYNDYDHYDDCTLSRIKDRYNSRKMIIGSEPVCIECGGMHLKERELNCCLDKPHRCFHCGRHLDAEEVISVNGYNCCEHCAQSEGIA